MNSHEVFIHIHQGCFAGTGAIVRLPQCQWSKPDGYRKISQCITTTKHSKAKTVCIFLGIYCKSTMTSRHAYAFCFTVPFRWESIRHRWIPTQRASIWANMTISVRRNGRRPPQRKSTAFGGLFLIVILSGKQSVELQVLRDAMPIMLHNYGSLYSLKPPQTNFIKCLIKCLFFQWWNLLDFAKTPGWSILHANPIKATRLSKAITIWLHVYQKNHYPYFILNILILNKKGLSIFMWVLVIAMSMDPWSQSYFIGRFRCYSESFHRVNYNGFCNPRNCFFLSLSIYF